MSSDPAKLRFFILLQPAGWRCVECAILHEWDVCEEQHPYICCEQAIIKWSWQVISADTNMWTTECNDERTRRVISSGDLYCCLLPQYEALRTCRLGFLIATKWYCDQAVKAMPSETFTKKVRLVQFIVKRMGCCCNLLVGVALNCAIHHEQDLREKQHPYIFGTNKQ